MSIKNKVQLVGHTGMNPEIKVFNDGGKLAKISLATNESYKNKAGEWIETTTWHNLVGWHLIAERLEKSVQKGTKLLIEGKLVNKKYQDKDNITRYTTEIEIKNFLVLDKKNDQVAAYATQGSGTGDHDLPF